MAIEHLPPAPSVEEAEAEIEQIEQSLREINRMLSNGQDQILQLHLRSQFLMGVISASKTYTVDSVEFLEKIENGTEGNDN